MDWNSVQQVVRSGVQMIAGFLVAKGMLPGSGSELFIGMGMSVAAFAWWWIWNRNQPSA